MPGKGERGLGNVIGWPVTLEGFLGPARTTKLDQYEFYCHNRTAIINSLPVNSYGVTASPIAGQRKKCRQITCKFNNHTVLGQFHRKVGSKSIWIGSNYTIQGHAATMNWHNFLPFFGITVGKSNKIVPVYLDFYSTLLVVIRLRLGNESVSLSLQSPPNE